MKLKKSSIFIIAILLLTAAVAVGIYAYHYTKVNGFGKVFYDENDSKIEKEVKLFVGAREMARQMGYDSIYPYYYNKVKGLEIDGEVEIKAIKLAEKDIIKKNAFYKEAVINGYKVSDSELKILVRNEIAKIKKSKNYGEIRAAYEKAGTTIEKEFNKNQRYNIIHFTIEKWDKDNQKRFKEAHESTPEDTGVNVSQKKEHYEKLVMKKFKSSRDFVVLSRALKYCRAGFKKYGSNVTGAKHYAKRMNVYPDLSYWD
ncbi:MAG: hypothetical protein SOR72_05550 [Hornefia sp.]|nr:hypothetical protein [Hornefia sp.]